MSSKLWTRATLLSKLATSDIFLERALLKMFDRQTSSEQNDSATREQNGIGFNGTDGFILSEFAKFAIRGKSQGRPEGKRLTPKQREVARRKLVKYAGQLLEEAKAFTLPKLPPKPATTEADRQAEFDGLGMYSNLPHFAPDE